MMNNLKTIKITNATNNIEMEIFTNFIIGGSIRDDGNTYLLLTGGTLIPVLENWNNIKKEIINEWSTVWKRPYV